MKRAFTLLLIMLIASSVLKCQPAITGMYTENLKNPLGIDSMNPRFTWIIESADHDVKQLAYEIRIGKSPLFEAVDKVWESGRVLSDQSVYIKYGSSELEPSTRYYWQVRIWDNKGNTSSWSEVSWWETGLLSNDNWKAKWISPQDIKDINTWYLRKEFRLKRNSKISSARIYLSSRGMYEACINGNRVGDQYFTPGWTSYNNRIQYQVYDITDNLKQGTNAIGIMLGEGWYKGRISRKRYGPDLAVIAHVLVRYDDGTEELVLTDGSWSGSDGPVRVSDIYDGEIYDTGKEIEGWSKAGFDDKAWAAVKVQDLSTDVIIASVSPPVRKHEQLKPLAIFRTPDGDLLADFGQNLVGWVKLRASGKKGDTLILSHAEVLDKNGNFYTDNLRGAKQRNIYILEDGEREYEPHFTWQGFRYVKLEGFRKDPLADDLVAYAIYSDLEETGKFITSNPDINQLQQNIVWGQRGNFVDVPTDCPQRDERLGWTGDAQAFALTSAYNMNVNSFFSKWLKDLAADQYTDGNVPVVIPDVLGKSTSGSAGWSDAATIVPWAMYEAYGDKRILEEQYESMKLWVDYLVNVSNNLLRNNGFHFGDWLFFSLDDDNSGRSAVTDKSLIAQCFFANSAGIVAETAKILGNNTDYKYYSELSGKIKNVFFEEFVTPAGQLVSNTQTAYVLALYFDMLPLEYREIAAQRLVKSIKAYGHITTGFLGTPYINHVLTTEGYPDIAYQLLMREEYPSWLYPVKMGATTIWERWNGIKPDGSFQYPSMNSFNHYAYGAIGDWMYKTIAGITPLEPGYKKIMIKPLPGGDLKMASGELKTYYGLIRSEWRIREDRFALEIEIPVNTKAEVYLPASSPDLVLKTTGLEPGEFSGLQRIEDGKVVLLLGSGVYSFEILIN